jgi:hypothetical protein
MAALPMALAKPAVPLPARVVTTPPLTSLMALLKVSDT